MIRYVSRLKLWWIKRNPQRRIAAYRANKITLADAVSGFDLRAKPNCPKCHGRGYIGIHRVTGWGVPCRCARLVVH